MGGFMVAVTGEFIGVLAVFVIFVMPILLGGLAIWLKHREKVLAMRGPATSEPDAKVVERIEKVEAECAKLREQLLAVHTLLADEQHQLDRKLSAMLPDSSADSRKTIGPERVQG